MGILFGFRASSIKTTVVERDASNGATAVISDTFTADPISDAVNNVRFGFNGFATDSASCIIELRSRAFFKFQIPEAARITVFGHTTFFGVTSVGSSRVDLQACKLEYSIVSPK